MNETMTELPTCPRCDLNDQVRVCDSKLHFHCLLCDFTFKADGTPADACELTPLPRAEDLEEIPVVRNFEVWARLKKSSKYYLQGVDDANAAKPKAQFFKVSFIPTFRGELALSKDAYSLKFNGNSYRIEDCELFLVDPVNTKNILRIV